MRKHKSTKNILALLKKHNQGIKLDVGCGFNKQPKFVGLDIRPVKGVDIIHDAESVPYPLPKESCHTILASHLVEHISPQKFMQVMAEWWRLLKFGGQLWISTPYAGSFGYWQDPTHINGCNEATWGYWSPAHGLYDVYKPVPFKIVKNAWWEHGNMEVILEKMTVKDGESEYKQARGIR
ncbi:methyltransferase domain-containing protein [Candidatus Omnitrophota bacterium]